MQPSSDLRARILDAARREPAATRQAHRWRTAALLLAGTTSLGGVFLLAGGVRLMGRPAFLVEVTGLGAALVALGALVGAFGRGRSMLGRPLWQLALVALAAPALLFAWKLGWAASFDLAMWQTERPGFRCLGWSLAMGAGPLVALVLARRGSDPIRPAGTGLGLGVAAGALAWALLDLWCPVAHPAHLLLGHVLPLVLLAGAGALLGRAVIAIRAS